MTYLMGNPCIKFFPILQTLERIWWFLNALTYADLLKTEHIHPPDFINAPPKLRLTVWKVKKWLYSQMFLCPEERFCEGCPIFGQPYPYGCNGFSSIKHLVHTHPNFVDRNEPFQFLIYFVGDEANADMCLYPTFRKVKHRTYFQISLWNTKCAFHYPPNSLRVCSTLICCASSIWVL